MLSTSWYGLSTQVRVRVRVRVKVRVRVGVRVEVEVRVRVRVWVRPHRGALEQGFRTAEVQTGTVDGKGSWKTIWVGMGLESGLELRVRLGSGSGSY